MYDLSTCLTFMVAYIAPGKQLMVLSRHRSRKRAEKALNEIMRFGENHPDMFEPDHYQILELYPKKRRLEAPNT